MTTTPKPQINLMDALQGFLDEAVRKARDPRDDNSVDYGTKDQGGRILLPVDPEPMPYRRAIQVLVDKEAAHNQEFALYETIPGMPLDAAYAFTEVLKERYGWVNPQTKRTIFGDQPPRMQVVKTGYSADDYVEVPIGKFKLPDITAELETGFGRPNKSNRRSQFMDFYISAEVRHEDRKIIMDLIAATRAYMAQHSIYKGKAMRLSVDDGGNLNALIEPEFMDLSKLDTRSLVLNDEVQGLVDVTLMTPIRKTQACRLHKIPLKRGILLHGPYGTGKTLTALVTAAEAIKNGWTYVMVDDVKALAATLEFARQFQPAVVFAEDIDRVIDKERSDAANDIVNTIDGAVGKDAELIVVLTTNHIEKLPPVVLRNGRLDALIPINLPDSKAAEQLVRNYAGALLGNQPLPGLGDKLTGYIPATIREVVERAKLAMLQDDRDTLSLSDLETVIFGLKSHAELLKDEKPKPSAAEELGLAFKRLLNGHGDGVDLSDMEEEIGNVNGSIGDVHDANMEQWKKHHRALAKIEEDGDAKLNQILSEVRRLQAR